MEDTGRMSAYSHRGRTAKEEQEAKRDQAVGKRVAVRHWGKAEVMKQKILFSDVYFFLYFFLEHNSLIEFTGTEEK